ncbi:MAG: hypothetical protein H6708_10430 [Kofleriaceae bacterium]|nr:hypothetical protein [Kofleriaceae bacterium]
MRRLDRPAHAVLGARRRTMVGHAAPVRALVVDGDAAVSASADGTIRAWALEDGGLRRTLALPPSTMMATTRGGPAAAPRSIGGTMPVLGAHAAVRVAPGRVAVAHGDGWVRTWDVERGVRVAEARLGGYVWALGVAGGRLACACDDGVLRVLDAATLAAVAEEPRPAAAAGAGEPYLCAVRRAAGAWVVGGAARGLSVHDVVTMRARGELRGVDAPPRALGGGAGPAVGGVGRTRRRRRAVGRRGGAAGRARRGARRRGRGRGGRRRRRRRRRRHDPGRRRRRHGPPPAPA